MILITSIGEFLLYYCQLFFISFHCKQKKKKVVAGLFLCCPVFAVGIHSHGIKNLGGRLVKLDLPQNLD